MANAGCRISKAAKADAIRQTSVSCWSDESNFSKLSVPQMRCSVFSLVP